MASEMLAAVPIVADWAQQLSARLPELAPHSEAWQLLAELVRRLFHDAHVASDLPGLTSLVDKWHALFVLRPQRRSNRPCRCICHPRAPARRQAVPIGGRKVAGPLAKLLRAAC